MIADVYSKSPANLGLPSIVQDCTDSVPPLADADMSVISRYMYSECSLEGIHCIYKHRLCIAQGSAVHVNDFKLMVCYYVQMLKISIIHNRI